MQTKQDDRERLQPSREWPSVALLGLKFGFGYVACAFALTVLAANCDYFVPGANCYRTSEVGDWLAGVSAPLAFIALVVAILIQSQELAAQQATLKAQLDELGLTRREFELNRAVMTEQAESMKLQADMLRDEAENRKRVEISALLEQRLRGFIASYERNLSGKTFTLSRFGNEAINFLPEFRTNPMGREVVTQLRDLSAFTESGYISEINARSIDFRVVRNQLLPVLDLQGQGFRSDDEKLVEFGADEMSEVLRVLGDQWENAGIDAV